MIALIGVLAISSAGAGMPCAGIDQSLSKARIAELAPIFAEHLKTTGVVPLHSLRSGGWTIIEAQTTNSDPPFVFYSKEPSRSQPVTLWSGAARRNETQQVNEWVLENAPGIPTGLAACFAWQVTEGRAK